MTFTWRLWQLAEKWYCPVTIAINKSKDAILESLVFRKLIDNVASRVNKIALHLFDQPAIFSASDDSLSTQVRDLYPY